MKILLLSAYHATSHHYWCEGLRQNFPDYIWEFLSLAPRHFAWRIRGNPLSWWGQHKAVLQREYDLIVASSMVDLACLRGLQPSLAQIPALLYFHENQFAYPLSAQANSQVEAQMVSLYSALSAQQLVFNSQYNRDSFFTGVDALLKKLPDEKPRSLQSQLSEKSLCLQVPLNTNDCVVDSCSRPEAGLRQVIWNHRWEYDKGPEGLLALLQALRATLPLQFHIVGQQFREQPAVMRQIHEVLEERSWLGHWGYIDDRQAYIALLQQADMVLSTALHDFQGLAVMEAAACGCTPVVPRRLAYPEFFSEDYCYRSRPEAPEEEARSAAELITRNVQSPRLRTARLSGATWRELAPRYREVFESVAGLAV